MVVYFFLFAMDSICLFKINIFLKNPTNHYFPKIDVERVYKIGY
jgi:hypothetical protein